MKGVFSVSYKETIKNRLAVLIAEEGINQKHIAKKLEIAESSLSKFKNGTYNLPYSELAKLDTFLTQKGY